jgi:hypothetical protein
LCRKRKRSNSSRNPKKQKSICKSNPGRVNEEPDTSRTIEELSLKELETDEDLLKEIDKFMADPGSISIGDDFWKRYRISGSRKLGFIHSL